MAFLQRAAVLAALVNISTATGALAQATVADPHHPDAAATEASPLTEPDGLAQQEQDVQPGEPGMMPPGMMSEMMGQGMMTGMMQSRGMNAMPSRGMHGHMMKIVFAVADADSDDALSFEEVSAIHRRIFDAVDADQNGAVTPEELQKFMQE
ncbi:EF-hand domain-containing protein [Paracoccus sp. SSK6]|uniref:EF-hand domain-containing protein n=1 Tax=Paracoccus sp. SSK6 TaxID=3143131 RepID=UPI00321B6F9D